MKNLPKPVQNCIDAINIYDSDYMMIRSTPINPVANIMKNIYRVVTLCNELIYDYYNEKNDAYCTVVSKMYS